MKRILLAGCFLSVSFTMAVAQQQAVKQASTNNAATPQAIDPKLLLVSKINQVDASISRNDPDQARQAISDVLGMMQRRMIEKNKSMETATPAQKETIAAGIQKDQQTYTDVKKLSVDMNANHNEMVAKMREFLKTY
ncbi:hypothetical protein ACTHGU_13070 [Chitinophagaceae bacterium MMS25-I14]